MIERIIEYSARNRFVVILAFALIIGWGVWALYKTPVDAIPDLSDNQVIVFTEWPGRSPQIMEDQVTYPLATNLQGLPKVKAVRATSMFGMSFIYVIFQDNVDIYWARTRVLERLNSASSLLPRGVVPMLGPDGTGVGHVYWYTVEGSGYDLGELRAIQDWFIRYQLNSVPGVAEVASIGGFVRQYQIDLDPNKLVAYGVNLQMVMDAVQRSNQDVGGKVLEMNSIQYYIRGLGYITSVRQLENIPVGTGQNGTPVYVRNIASVQLGGDLRLGLLDKNGNGEVVGGIIVMRYGENAKDVIDHVKEKIKQIQKGLPAGVEIKTAYDRSDLIKEAVGTLQSALTEEMIVVSLIIILFLFHFRSAATVIIALPISVIISFIFMYHFNITSNIMSLGGIAIAIGVLVDASIVIVENAYRHLSEAEEAGQLRGVQDYIEIVIKATKQVGRAIFFSLSIIVVSFLPVFLLEGQEGKLFHPLAFTKTFALAGSALIAITLVPMLLSFLMRGRFKPESANPLSRFFGRLYEPLLRLALKYRKTTLAINLLALLITIPMIMSIGTEFMPPLDEGSLLFMPVTLPNASITEVKRIMQVQDKIIASFPEVAYVLGKVGRAETSTDPAPISMIETIVLLKPRSEWREGMTRERIISELDERLQIPGVRNGWTQPIINRINMLSTGVRTDLGVKVFGDNLDTLEALAIKAERILQEVPGAVDLYADRVMGGDFLDINVKPQAVARYGINAGDVLNVVEMVIGGENISMTVEGRRRFPIRARFARDYRDNLDAIKRILVPVPPTGGMKNKSTPTTMAADPSMGGMGESLPTPQTAMPESDGAARSGVVYIPLAQLADIHITSGPPMINSENGLLRSVVFLNVRGRDMGSFVQEAKRALDQKLRLPTGYYIDWSGQYEHQLRAQQRLSVIIPLVFVIIFLLLYFAFRSVIEASLVMLSVPFALIGGVYLQYILGYNFSVAVWVGFIALYGVAVETGVVMVVYLHEALDKRLKLGSVSNSDIMEATLEGSLLRLRPKLMTVGTTLIGLTPIMFSAGTGADVMRPIAAPLIGGMITSAMHVLLVTPVIFSLMKERDLKKGRLEYSSAASKK